MVRTFFMVGTVAVLGWSQPVEQAKRAFDAGDYALAAKLFEQAQAASPRCDTLFYLGLARYRLHQVDAALIAFQSAVECDPKLVPAHLALAEAYGIRDNEAQTLASLERVLSLEPTNLAALRHASTLYLKNELNDKAVPLLERLVKLDNADLQSRLDLAVAYAATGNREGAEREYREVLRQRPDSASALTGLGNLAVKAGNEQAAIELLSRAVAVTPNASEPRFLLGSAYNRLGRFQEAATELEAALRLGGEGPEVHYHLARAYGGLDRTEDRRKALARFNELNRQSKDDIELQRKALRLIESSKALVYAGDLAGAVRQLEEARKLRPRDDGVLYRLGTVYLDLRQYDVALSCAKEAIQIAPSQWVYQYLLGTIEMSTGQWQAARTSLELAVTLNPSAAEAHNALGNVALRLNDKKAAIASFQRASELDPKEISYRLNLESIR